MGMEGTRNALLSWWLRRLPSTWRAKGRTTEAPFMLLEGAGRKAFSGSGQPLNFMSSRYCHFYRQTSEDQRGLPTVTQPGSSGARDGTWSPAKALIHSTAMRAAKTEKTGYMDFFCLNHPRKSLTTNTSPFVSLLSALSSFACCFL